MAEMKDAVMPILQKIQQDVADGRKDLKALDAKINDMAENILDVKDDVAEIKRDNLMHLGLTARQRVEFDELRNEVKDLKSRVAALEARP